MMNRYTFWLWVAAIAQLSTAALHSLSFLTRPNPENETEKQLYDLMNNYKFEAGAGFDPSMSDLYTGLSACFTLLYLFGGFINVYLLQKQVPQETMKGLTGVSILIFGIAFLVMLVFTFLPPVVLSGLVFFLLCLAYAKNHVHFMASKEN